MAEHISQHQQIADGDPSAMLLRKQLEIHEDYMKLYQPSNNFNQLLFHSIPCSA